MNKLPEPLAGVLFDLDGTLLDSAPDLYEALIRYCAELGVAPPLYERVRQVVSRGSRAILRTAFPEDDDETLLALIPRYLTLYENLLAAATRPFAGVGELLDGLEAQGIAWGIVTNKAAFLTDELVRRIGWSARAAAVVSGDTLPVKKPDPAPVLLACARAGVEPRRSVFVGDDRRDVQAGAAAGLFTVAVSWGYLDGGDPHAWGADAVVDTPAELAALLRLKQALA